MTPIFYAKYFFVFPINIFDKNVRMKVKMFKFRDIFEETSPCVILNKIALNGNSGDKNSHSAQFYVIHLDNDLFVLYVTY